MDILTIEGNIGHDMVPAGADDMARVELDLHINRDNIICVTHHDVHDDGKLRIVILLQQALVVICNTDTDIHDVLHGDQI